ncbi:MAG: sugar ABC transporter substrate-binding protein [Planctomycetota bacterium]|nr:sugar ABC transporter substrate-binding protein [Planctomycetota bacterium]
MKTRLGFMVVALAAVMFAGFAPAEDTTLGVAIRTLTNPYQANYKVGGELFAKEAGAPLVVLTCEGSSEKQVNDVIALVARTQGNVVFMIDPNEATDIVPIARALEREGVYYATWWNKPEEMKVWDYPHWVTHMSFDGISAGKFTAEALFKTFKTPGKGKIVALQGMLANTTAQERFVGLNQAIAANPGVELLTHESADWDRTRAYEKTKSMLVAYPDIDGIWCANDNMALGALEALRERGLAGKVLVTGVDGTDELLEAIKKGEGAATVYNDSKYQAGISLAQCLAVKQGKLKVADIPKEKRQFFAQAVNVDQGNVADIIKNYVQGTTDYNFADLFGGFVRAME